MSLIRYVTRIHFADRAMEDALPEELRARRLAAPLILADPDAGEALPRLLDCLPPGARPRIVRIGPGGAQGPAAALAADAGDCDLVIGLGGADAIDLARTARPGPAGSLHGSQHGSRPGSPAGQVRSAGPLPGRVPSAGPGPAPVPRMAIPTLPGCLGLGPVRPRSAAPGSGRAVTGTAAPVPCVLFCDPWLMQYAAPGRLAVTGMDALVHCLEALLSTAWNPPADGMAFDGLRRAGTWLERLCADPADPEARREVMAAALNGALAAQKGLGAIHALAHACESLPVGSPGDGPGYGQGYGHTDAPGQAGTGHMDAGPGYGFPAGADRTGGDQVGGPRTGGGPGARDAAGDATGDRPADPRPDPRPDLHPDRHTAPHADPHTGHGALHAALLGPALDFNAPAVPGRIAQAAEALRLPDPARLPGHLQDLGARLGLPRRLAHLGLTGAGIARLAEVAAADPANRSNPRLATAQDYVAMIRAAL